MQARMPAHRRSCCAPSRCVRALWLCCLVLPLMSGCAGLTDVSPIDWIRNGFKVGPNYQQPPAAVAEDWIDFNNPKLISASAGADDFAWWQSFNDPVLSDFVQSAYQQNLTLRAAGMRVIQARMKYAVAESSLFPQEQSYRGRYMRIQRSTKGDLTGLNRLNNRLPIPIQIPRNFDSWDSGFSLGWELDFWGRFRRAIEAADAGLDASVNDYDEVLVTLLADTATAYVQIREYQDRIRLAEQNIKLQRITYEIAKARFDQGAVSELDLDQAEATLANTEALVPSLRISLRMANNKLCLLLGMPTLNLVEQMSAGPIPTAPKEVVVGIPAELIRRRPDVRASERRVAEQSALIGVAAADLYPEFHILGTISWHANDFGSMFNSAANAGVVGPSFNWKILNYGRIANNIRGQTARFQEFVFLYQQSVLRANEEAENAIVAYLESQLMADALQKSVRALERANEVALVQYRNGEVNFNRIAYLQRELVSEQDNLASAQAEVSLSLIQIYRALGGGWQIRCRPMPMPVVVDPGPESIPPPIVLPPVEELPQG